MTALATAGRRRAPRSAPLVAAALAVGAAAGLSWAPGADPHTTHIPLCPLHALTGWWCPLCGSLRAVWDAGHGQWLRALGDNALLFAAAPWLIAAWLGWAGIIAPRPWPRRSVRWLALGLATAFAIVRNTPAGAWLAPSAGARG